ncbi:Glycine cleavage system transcriptional activator [Roseovarius albus]|uniref:Glycine cleavage system transcriptional activator n=1 Tax=Roseovarius albus TaxID=1247867 RepID=A0A1X6ZVR6_9RHOB|nr:LysR family transcriptional regulator [Roseovarius albus]SLN63248.1 Glycine cleavage system transcriptional activator [Roseovarius albus]
MSVSPPRPKGPPLNALRAFEAAARLGGFAQASEELCVTPGAISQHIKTLEDWTGTPLFQRKAHGVVLTEDGQRLLPHFTQAFDALGNATRALRATMALPTITIAALPSIAQLWLSPRMPALRAAMPEVRFTILAMETPPNLSRELIDISLFMRPTSDDENQHILCEDHIFPVCTSEVAKQIVKPVDLLDHTLIHDESWSDDWDLWLKKYGPDVFNTQTEARYSLYSLALDDARAGAGVLMGHAALVNRDLEKGILVRPLEGFIQTDQPLIMETSPLKNAPKEVSDCAHYLMNDHRIGNE